MKPKTFTDHLKEVKGKVIYFDGKNIYKLRRNKNGISKKND